MTLEPFQDRKLDNLLQSFGLLGGMALLLAILGYLVFGSFGLVLAAAVSAAVLSLGSHVSPRWILRFHRARPMDAWEAPRLVATIRDLARRADLPSVPRLFYLPSPQPNAFALGSAADSAIGVTDGLLRRLSHRELRGVLAHEVSHVKNRDLRIMSLAGAMTHLTQSLSYLGPLILVLALLGQASVPWLTLFLLMAAPTISALLQLALSRTRELNADLDAARLTGDPLALASALAKLEAGSGNWLWRILTPYRVEESPILRSHPATAERIRRLRSLAQAPVPRVVRRPSRAVPGVRRSAPALVPARLHPRGGRWIHAPEVVRS